MAQAPALRFESVPSREIWKPVSRKLAEREVGSGGDQYGIDYQEILSLVENGEVVEIGLENVSEGAIRSAISYHSRYIGKYIRCRLTKDRNALLIHLASILK